jgi:hypothetical protein
MGHQQFKTDIYTKGGAVTAGTVGGSVNNGVDTYVYTKNGTGLFYFAFFQGDADADHTHLLKPFIQIDGLSIEPLMTYQEMNTWGFANTTDYLKLLQYGVDALCIATLYIPTGLPFNSQFRIGVYNGGTGAIPFWARYLISEYE